jgi:DNA-binding beta-propeller fold protein YncE
MRLFSVCDGKTMVITDARDGKQLGKATIGDGPDAAGFSPRHNLAFSSNGEGTLTVVNAGLKTYPVVESLPSRRGGRTMAYDEATDRIYISTAEYGPAPAPTPEHPHPRPVGLPGSFAILVVGR